ncbi:alpha/beta hydrolase-fold protein [Kineosporia succinea]|uniref:Acyl-CoA:diacylglycerol acyltransferase n=1 Tax=Kineosporia succinea TaxID=84632 RepID=A0ABT9P9W9_9ACTN|nr:alpha/beta hydrolase-fold protein [Kineosporia succinea]MDP9829277.1 acetyl esterase/lipase [Kineosporia succinea]
MVSSGQITRRVLLAGAAGVALSGAAVGGSLAGVLPGRAHLRRTLDIGQVVAGAPEAGGDEPTYATFASRARGTDVTWGWVTPPDLDPDGLPVVLSLHGRGDDAHSSFEALGLHQFLAQHVRDGGAPFGVVSVDGGETYWHPRASGDDPMAMIEDELLARVGALGFSTARVGVLGYSMGGLGALLLAREASHGRFGAAGQVVAAAASSPALFASAGATSAGSFDDAGDFGRYGALSREPGVAEGFPLSVSCGVDDPFRAETERYRGACVPMPEGSIGDGAHTMDYWRSQIPAQFRFLAGHLAA